MSDLYPGSLTDVAGLLVGHAGDDIALTGCTVIVCPDGATAGVSVRGLAPGSREMAVLRPGNLVPRIDAVLLTGGSAFGLAAADGVMTTLEQRGLGYAVGSVRVPIVPAAVLYDLGIGDPRRRPDAQMGTDATVAASAEPVEQGNVGAGTGATVGKLLGAALAMKSGLGSASLQVGELVVSALVAVNALGDILDDTTGQIIAGARAPDPSNPDPSGIDEPGFANTARVLATQPIPPPPAPGNTVIGAVATNARLDPAQCAIMADAAHDGLARVCRPAHTLYDGDTFFGLSTHDLDASFVQVCELASQVMARAIVNAVRAASDAGGLPCAATVCELGSHH